MIVSVPLPSAVLSLQILIRQSCSFPTKIQLCYRASLVVRTPSHRELDAETIIRPHLIPSLHQHSRSWLSSTMTASGHTRKLSKMSPLRYSSTFTAYTFCKSASDCLSRSSLRLELLGRLFDRRSVRFEKALESEHELVDDQLEIELVSDTDDVGSMSTEDIDDRGDVGVDGSDGSEAIVLSLDNVGRIVA
jgi:hypothetical protein